MNKSNTGSDVLHSDALSSEMSNIDSNELVFEVLRKNHRHVERVSITPNQTISIGRAWNNTITVQDQFVDANHLTITLDEGNCLSATDNNTLNGSEINGQHLHDDVQTLELNHVIRIGDTSITIHDANSDVEPAIERSVWFSPKVRSMSVWVMLALTALTVVVALAESWLGSVREYQFRDGVTVVLGLILTFFVWIVSFGSMGKLLRGESNMKSHWLLCCGFYITLSLIVAASALLHFNTHSLFTSQAFRYVVGSVVAIVFLFGTLTIASNLGAFGRWAWSILLVSTVLLSVHSSSLFLKEHQRWSSYSDTELVALPSALLFRQASSVDSHFDNVDDLFDFDGLELSDGSD